MILNVLATGCKYNVAITDGYKIHYLFDLLYLDNSHLKMLWTCGYIIIYTFLTQCICHSNLVFVYTFQIIVCFLS